MHTIDDTMSMFRENKSFCSCIGGESKEITCKCGEFDLPPEWKWDKKARTPTAVLSPDSLTVYFHKGYSVGNACVRGDTPLTFGNDYYWEIKMCSNVYGTSMMVGVGTKSFKINQYSETFRCLLGCDSESWGLTFNGKLYHNKEYQNYNPLAGFTIGSIIGVHLDMWNGTLEFYLNRIPLGIAFTGLRDKVLYPLISSTASHTTMKLIYSHSEPHTLVLSSLKYINEDLLKDLPPGLKSYSKNCWWLFPKSTRLNKKEYLPALHSVDLLTDSDSSSSDDDNGEDEDNKETEEDDDEKTKKYFQGNVFSPRGINTVRTAQGSGMTHPYYLSHFRQTRAYRHKLKPWMDF